MRSEVEIQTTDAAGHWAAGLIMAVLLSACGGSSTPTAPAAPVPTPNPCTQTTLVQVDGPVSARTLGRVPFSATAPGRLDVTVDWTFAASPIGVYVVSAGTCTIAQFNAATCTFLALSETSAKPRKISVSNVAGGNYELLAANFSGVDESLSGQVVLSSSTCAAFTSFTGPAVSMSRRSDNPLFESVLR
jgi:hypothetical protein